LIQSRLQKVNFFVRGQANSECERCGSCNYLKSLVVRLSPLDVICEFRLFAGDSDSDDFLVILANADRFLKTEYIDNSTL